MKVAPNSPITTQTLGRESVILTLEDRVLAFATIKSEGQERG